MAYLVQELVAQKWYTVRRFTTKQEAEQFAAWLGRKTRIKEAH